MKTPEMGLENLIEMLPAQARTIYRLEIKLEVDGVNISAGGNLAAKSLCEIMVGEDAFRTLETCLAGVALKASEIISTGENVQSCTTIDMQALKKQMQEGTK